MVIGIPKEIKNNENRISILPFGVEELKRYNHTIYIEYNAGIGSGFTNDEYLKAGANILDTPEEIFEKSDIIVKVKEPQENEVNLIIENQIIFTYFHFAANLALTKGIIDSKATAIAYETVELDNGTLPLLTPMSEVAGRMAIQNGAKCLEGNMGGKDTINFKIHN